MLISLLFSFYSKFFLPHGRWGVKREEVSSNQHDYRLIYPKTFLPPSFPPPPTPGDGSPSSPLSHFQSLTSLSQAPLCFHLKTKIYVNLWAGVNAERLVRNSIPKSWHCCWKWQGRPVNPTMRSSKCVIMLCVGRRIWISKRRHAPLMRRLQDFQH